MPLPDVIAVKRDRTTKKVLRVALRIDTFGLTLVPHPTKPRTLIKASIIDYSKNVIGEDVWMPPALWNACHRRAYAIFFPPRKRKKRK